MYYQCLDSLDLVSKCCCLALFQHFVLATLPLSRKRRWLWVRTARLPGITGSFLWVLKRLLGLPAGCTARGLRRLYGGLRSGTRGAKAEGWRVEGAGGAEGEWRGVGKRFFLVFGF